jgi:hypothetical protein
MTLEFGGGRMSTLPTVAASQTGDIQPNTCKQDKMADLPPPVQGPTAKEKK